MHPTWERRRNERRIEVEPLTTAATDIGLPPEVVWGYLTQPRYRAVITASDRVSLENRKMGRIGPESQFQCFHGKHVVRQVIVEWTPFERIVSQDTDTMPLLNKLTWKCEYRLVPTDSGTHLSISLGDFEGTRLRKKVVGLMLSRGAKQVERNLRGFAALAEEDWAEQRASHGGSPTIVLTAELIRDAASRSLSGP